MELDEWKAGGGYFEHNGLPIFYRRDGSGNRILLCLHGFPTASFDYHKIWADLSRSFSVIAYDMVGYGFSAKPAQFGYTTFDQVHVLQDLLRHLGVGNVHILSHDYGNTIVQELLARQAEGGLGFEIATICMLNGALFPETHRPIFAQKLLIGPIGFLFGRLIPDSVFKKNLASVFGVKTQPTPAELDDLARLFNHNGGKQIAHKLIRYMTEREKYRGRWVPPLTRLKLPFRFINGVADPVSGKHLVERFRKIVPDQADIVELPGIGHFPHLEAPETVLKKFREFHDIILEYTTEKSAATRHLKS